jgi:hypothetical protein
LWMSSKPTSVAIRTRKTKSRRSARHSSSSASPKLSRARHGPSAALWR